MFHFFRKLFAAADSVEDSPTNLIPHSRALPLPDLTVESKRFQTSGNAFLAEGNFTEAASCYQQVVAISPRDIAGYLSLGYTQMQLEHWEDAEKTLTEALQIESNNTDLLYMLATLSRDLNRPDAAVKYFHQLLAIMPLFEVAHAELCEVLMASDRNDEAMSVIDKGLICFPLAARFHYLHGVLCARASAHDRAEASFITALALQPDFADLYFHLAATMHAKGRMVDAIENYRRAISLQPDHAAAHSNLGTALFASNQHEEALVSFSEAIKHQPSLADAHYNEGLCRLQMGDMKRGWPKYEWRWKNKKFMKSKRQFVQPLWLGQDALNGKTILLHFEQGLGDTIQFCRYAPQLAQRGATVLLLVQRSLGSLLSSLKGVSQIVYLDQPMPPFDFHCPLLSLPLAFDTNSHTVPCDVPYLTALPDLSLAVRAALPINDRFRVGLCWKGNPDYPKDMERSPGIGPFHKLMSRLTDKSVDFYTLLPNSRAEFLAIGGKDFGHDLDICSAPFAETAALIMNLDLVITCDTAVGHVAGAMGKIVWLVLPFSADWRWTCGRDDSPWYPHTRLFRQTMPGDWTTVFEAVAVRLEDALNGSSSLLWEIGANCLPTLPKSNNKL